MSGEAGKEASAGLEDPEKKEKGSSVAKTLARLSEGMADLSALMVKGDAEQTTEGISKFLELSKPTAASTKVNQNLSGQQYAALQVKLDKVTRQVDGLAKCQVPSEDQQSLAKGDQSRGERGQGNACATSE